MNHSELILENVQLRPYNSMKISCIAEAVYFPSNTQNLEYILDKCHGEYILLGGGSNTIFSKPFINTPVISTKLMSDIYEQDGYVYAQAGVRLCDLAWFALEKGIKGFEFLEDIPGTVGGALTMNAGTYEDTISKLVASVTIYDIEKNKYQELSAEQLETTWGKRESYFQHHKVFIVSCKCTIRERGEQLEILDKILNIKRTRYTKQPRQYPSAGSVFKRPYLNGEPYYVWKLLTETNMVGYRIGGAEVSKKHPGFIVNIDNASGQDVIDLMRKCQEVVFDKYGIELTEEWKLV